MESIHLACAEVAKVSSLQCRSIHVGSQSEVCVERV